MDSGGLQVGGVSTAGRFSRLDGDAMPQDRRLPFIWTGLSPILKAAFHLLGRSRRQWPVSLIRYGFGM